MAVTRDDVIHTAIQLLQEVGLDGLTLRRLATELGISAPTLYWHFRDKRELLDAMAEVMVGEFREKQPPIPEHLPWEEKIAESMRQQYRAIMAYRDGARVLAGNRPTESTLPMIELFLSRWIAVGFPPAEALAMILTMGDFVLGSALEYQAELERQRLQSGTADEDLWTRMEAFPNLRAAATARKQALTDGRRDSFEYGLSLMIAGLRERLKSIKAQKKAEDAGTSASD
jgi:TetR/AcrR family transcriptional regulator, tetracycline repressor protein